MNSNNPFKKYTFWGWSNLYCNRRSAFSVCLYGNLFAFADASE